MQLRDIMPVYCDSPDTVQNLSVKITDEDGNETEHEISASLRYVYGALSRGVTPSVVVSVAQHGE